MAARGEVFLINLGGMELPEKTLNEIERDINKVVEAKIATVDKLKGQATKIPLGGMTRGIWIMKQLANKPIGK